MDEDVEYISTNNPMPTYFQFTYVPEGDEVITSITIDASDMQKSAQYKPYYSSIPVTGCKDNAGGGKVCKVKNSLQIPGAVFNQLTINVNDPEVTIKFKFAIQDAETQELEYTKTFSVDNTRPKVISIKSDNCDASNNCYVASKRSNKVTIDMEDEQASFNRLWVVFKVGNELSYVSDCDGLTCYGYVSPQCNIAGNLPVSITNYLGSPSMDDARNAIIQDKSFFLICDPDIPQLVVDSKQIISSVGGNAAPLEESFTVQVEVIEKTSPTVSLTVIGDSIDSENVTASCLKARNKFVCNAAITAGAVDAGDYVLPLIIKDLAGNELRDEIDVRLLSATEKAPKIWKTKSVTQSSNSFLKSSMAFERTLYVSTNLTGRAGSRIVDVKAGAHCSPVIEGTTGFQGDISSINVLDFNEARKNEIVVVSKITIRESGSPNRYADLSKLEFECPLELVSVRGLRYYTLPQEENFTITINLKEGPTFYRNLEQEVKSVKSSVDNKLKIIKGYQLATNQIQQLCRICGFMTQTSVAMAGVEGTTSLLPFGQGISRTAGDISQRLGQDGNDGICGTKGVRTVCDFMACKKPYQSYLTDQLDSDGWLQDTSEYLGYNNFSDTMNPYKSLFVAAATLCVPAIMYHYQTYTGIECNYLRCLTEGTSGYGASVERCKQDKSTSECAFIWGAIADGIPIVSMIRDTAGRLADVVNDPVTLIGFANPFICKWAGGGSGTIVHSACNTVNNALSTLNVLNSVSDIFKPQGDPSSTCMDMQRYVSLDPKDWQRIGNFPEQEQATYTYDLGNGKHLDCVNTDCGIRGTTTKIIPTNAVNDPNPFENADNFVIYNDNKLQYDRYSLDKRLNKYHALNSQTIQLQKAMLDRQQLARNNLKILMNGGKATKTPKNKPITYDPDIQAKINAIDGSANLQEFNSKLNGDKPFQVIPLVKMKNAPSITKPFDKMTEPEINNLAKDLGFPTDEQINNLDNAEEILRLRDQQIKEHIETTAEIVEQIGSSNLEARRLNEDLDFTRDLGLFDKDGNYISDSAFFTAISESTRHRRNYYNQLMAKNPELKDSIQGVMDAEREYADFIGSSYDKLMKSKQTMKSQNTLDNKYLDRSGAELKGSNPAYEEELRKALGDVLIEFEQDSDNLAFDDPEYLQQVLQPAPPTPKEKFIKRVLDKIKDPKFTGDVNDAAKEVGNKLAQETGNDAYKDLLQKSIEKNKENSEKLNTELEEASKKIKDKKDELKTMDEFNKRFGSYKDVFKSAWGAAKGLASVRKLFDADWGTFSDNTLFGGLRSFLINDVSQVELNLCSAAKSDSKKAGTGDGVILNMVGGGSYRSGAYVTGRRSAQVTQDPTADAPYYGYWVSGSVATFKKEGLKFRVIITGSKGSKDITKDVTGMSTAVVGLNSQVPFGIPNGNYFEDEKLYDKICILFVSQNLNQYFDYVDIDNKRLCQKIISEE